MVVVVVVVVAAVVVVVVVVVPLLLLKGPVATVLAHISWEHCRPAPGSQHALNLT